MRDPSLSIYRVLSPAEASELTTISEPVLERWRRLGGGPRFIKLSPRRIGYRMADLEAWIAERAESGGQAAKQHAA